MAHPAGNEGIRKDGNTPRRATHPAAGNKDASPLLCGGASRTEPNPSCG